MAGTRRDETRGDMWDAARALGAYNIRVKVMRMSQVEINNLDVDELSAWASIILEECEEQEGERAPFPIGQFIYAGLKLYVGDRADAPMYVAACRGQVQTLTTMVTHPRGDPEDRRLAMSQNAFAPLRVAVQNGDLASVKVLMRYGAPVCTPYTHPDCRLSA